MRQSLPRSAYGQTTLPSHPCRFFRTTGNHFAYLLPCAHSGGMCPAWRAR
nr:MAG TPA: hypothetical protein [Caudoviricetes sp.]